MIATHLKAIKFIVKVHRVLARPKMLRLTVVILEGNVFEQQLGTAYLALQYLINTSIQPPTL